MVCQPGCRLSSFEQILKIMYHEIYWEAYIEHDKKSRFGQKYL